MNQLNNIAQIRASENAILVVLPFREIPEAVTAIFVGSEHARARERH
jgi:hypothetical protein